MPTDETTIAEAMKSKSTTTLVCGKQGNGKLVNYSIHVASGPPTSSKVPPNKFLLDLFGRKVAFYYRGDTYLFAMTKAYTSSAMVDI